MSGTADLVIPSEVLERAHFTAQDLAIEIATHLYAVKRLNMSQARRLANLDLMSFQSELAKRDIYIHMTVEDVKADVMRLRSGLEK